MLIQNVNREKMIGLSPSGRASSKKTPSTTLLRTPFQHLTRFPLNNQFICRGLAALQ